MKVSDYIIEIIKNRYANKSIYLGEIELTDLQKSKLNITDKFENAEILLGENIIDFCKDVIITNTSNNYAYAYVCNALDKSTGLSVYERRKYIKHNNYYRHNHNPNLYDLEITKPARNNQQSIEVLKNKYADKRLLIVASGHSWKEIDYTRLASDVMIMVINYNFEIKADFQFYYDKELQIVLESVKFKDGRKIIGCSTHRCNNLDYYYEVGKDCNKVCHSGAYALQIAQGIGFKEIYLIGYDYKRVNDTDYTYDKGKTLVYLEKRSKTYINDFTNFNIFDNVYNLNKQSNLKKIKFGNKENLYAN